MPLSTEHYKYYFKTCELEEHAHFLRFVCAHFVLEIEGDEV